MELLNAHLDLGIISVLGVMSFLTVAFVVAADGRITQVRIVQSAGDPDLDRAALEALNRLGRFKPIPAVPGRSSWSMRVPIRFDLRQRGCTSDRRAMF